MAPRTKATHGLAVWRVLGVGAEEKLESLQQVRLRGAVWNVATTWSDASGRLEPASITVSAEDKRPVIADVLRNLPLGALQQEARQQGAEVAQKLPIAAAAWEASGRASAEHLAPSMRRAAAVLGEPGGHRGVATSRDELEQVAAVYRTAWYGGNPVTKAVANAFGISTSTAGKRIIKARRTLPELFEDIDASIARKPPRKNSTKRSKR